MLSSTSIFFSGTRHFLPLLRRHSQPQRSTDLISTLHVTMKIKMGNKKIIRAQLSVDEAHVHCLSNGKRERRGKISMMGFWQVASTLHTSVDKILEQSPSKLLGKLLYFRFILFSRQCLSIFFIKKKAVTNIILMRPNRG